MRKPQNYTSRQIRALCLLIKGLFTHIKRCWKAELRRVASLHCKNYFLKTGSTSESTIHLNLAVKSAGLSTACVVKWLVFLLFSLHLLFSVWALIWKHLVKVKLTMEGVTVSLKDKPGDEMAFPDPLCPPVSAFHCPSVYPSTPFARALVELWKPVADRTFDDSWWLKNVLQIILGEIRNVKQSMMQQEPLNQRNLREELISKAHITTLSISGDPINCTGFLTLPIE